MGTLQESINVFDVVFFLIFVAGAGRRESKSSFICKAPTFIESQLMVV